MKKKYGRHSNDFKFKVAVAALKGDKTIVELCQKFGLAASQIYEWKKQLEERGSEIFSSSSAKKKRDEEIRHLHTVIGKLKVENDFLEGVLNH